MFVCVCVCVCVEFVVLPKYNWLFFSFSGGHLYSVRTKEKRVLRQNLSGRCLVLQEFII